MTGEQLLQIGLAFAGLIFSGGGIAAIYGVIVTRKLGIKTGENEANRDLNSTWDAIVENLQGQINTQTANFTEQVKGLHAEINSLKNRQGELEGTLNFKERLLLKAVAHMYKLELLIPDEKIPVRPEGLD